MASEDAGAARVAAWRVSTALREAVSALSEVETSTKGGGAAGVFSVVLGRIAWDLEQVAERVERACDELQAQQRASEGDDKPATVAGLLARGDQLPAPDALALAVLVDAADECDPGDGWERRDAVNALAWLVAGNETAAGTVRELLAGVQDPAEPGCLLEAAKGRP